MLLIQLNLGKVYEDNDRLSDAEAAYIKALDSNSPITHQNALDSLQRVIKKQKEKKEAELLKQLHLGKIYEDNGRLKDAEAVYIKVLDSDLPVTQQDALDSLQRVVREQKLPHNKYLFTPLSSAWTTGVTAFGTVLLTVLLVLFIVLVLWWPVDCLGRRRGRNKLEIVPFIDSTQNKLGANFDEITAITLEKMRYHFKPRGLIRGQAKLPVIARSQSAELAELTAAVVPGGPGKFIAWIMRRANQPEYSIRGSLKSNGQEVNIIVRLEKSGEALQTWDRIFVATALFQEERDLAYEVLIFLKEYMNP